MIRKLAYRLCAITLISSLFFSCDTHYFSEPQPVDAGNLYKFPRKLRGDWSMKGDKEPMVITADRIVIKVQERIFNGVQSSTPLDTLRVEGQWTSHNALQTRVWSKPLGRVDTVSNYIIRGKRIYEKETDRLNVGIPFEVVGDSIQMNGVITLVLGQTMFLRKVNDTTYVVNVRLTNVLEEMEAKGPWWTLVLFEIDSRNRLYRSDLNESLKEGPGLIAAFGDSYFYDIRWTAKEILALRAKVFETRNDYFERMPSKR